MNKYGPKARSVIAKTMGEYQRGRLRSGRARLPVRDRQQALAIGISRARKKRYKVPKGEHNY
jgi:Family of unknown function (DUF6496)